VKINLSAAIVI